MKVKYGNRWNDHQIGNKKTLARTCADEPRIILESGMRDCPVRVNTTTGSERDKSRNVEAA
jgi:hypothetical protein